MGFDSELIEIEHGLDMLLLSCVCGSRESTVSSVDRTVSMGGGSVAGVAVGVHAEAFATSILELLFFPLEPKSVTFHKLLDLVLEEACVGWSFEMTEAAVMSSTSVLNSCLV